MKPYIISQRNDNAVVCDAELIICSQNDRYALQELYLLSICDVTTKVKKVLSDILAGTDGYSRSPNDMILMDREDPAFNMRVSGYSSTFKYKIAQINGTLAHAIVYRVNDDLMIDWENIGITDLATRHLRQKMHKPVTSELVSKMVEAQENDPDLRPLYKELRVLTCNECYSNLKAYIICPYNFNYYLSNVKLEPNKKAFDWTGINTIEDYIMKFIDVIKVRLQESVSILYDQDKLSPYIFDMKRLPYAGQVPIIQCGLEVLKNNRTFFLGAEQGMGKTQMSISIIRAYFKERAIKGFNALLIVPAITIKQWDAELRECIPEAIKTYIIRSTSEFIRLYSQGFSNPQQPNFYIVGKETFKLTYSTKPCYIKRHRTVSERYTEYEKTGYSYQEVVKTRQVGKDVLCCPRCDAVLENTQRRETAYLTENDFSTPKKSNKRCFKCGQPLWAASYEKTKKTSLIDYIQLKKISFDMGIIDEIQESANSDSIIGAATRTVISHFKRAIFCTGTSNNGYTSSLFNVLMGIRSRSLVNDKVAVVEDFVKNFGSLKSVIKESDPNYRLSGKIEIKESQTREIEGISPVVFAKYLCENYLFSSISELTDKKLARLADKVKSQFGVDLKILELPELSETYVPIEHDMVMAANEAKLFNGMWAINARLGTMLIGSIVRHYTNNPFNWDPVSVRARGGGYDQVYPECVPSNTVLEKEKKLLALCAEQKERGRQTWIYSDFTGDGSTSQYMTGQPIPLRLKSLLEQAGLSVYWLRPSVSPIARKEVIEKNKDVYDIFISNPKLVQVGINMAWCPTYIFYMPSFEVNVIDQACRRGYRANSSVNNEIFYLYYENSKEKDICERMQLKKAESKAIEAKFDITLQVGRTASAFSARIDSAIKESEKEALAAVVEEAIQIEGGSIESEILSGRFIVEALEIIDSKPRESKRKRKNKALSSDEFIQLEFVL